MKNSKTVKWTWLVVALQIVFLLGWAGFHEMVREIAPTVRLKTLPVDPRDILRGDYMILNYEISRPGPGRVPVDRDDDNVFVVLGHSAGHHVISEILADEPAPEDTRLWVRAKAWGPADNPQLDYGIDRFFVPEGRGTPNFKKMEVEASVSATHHLYIRRLWLDGKEFP